MEFDKKQYKHYKQSEKINKYIQNFECKNRINDIRINKYIKDIHEIIIDYFSEYTNDLLSESELKLIISLLTSINCYVRAININDKNRRECINAILCMLITCKLRNVLKLKLYNVFNDICINCNDSHYHEGEYSYLNLGDDSSLINLAKRHCSIFYLMHKYKCARLFNRKNTNLLINDIKSDYSLQPARAVELIAELQSIKKYIFFRNISNFFLNPIKAIVFSVVFVVIFDHFYLNISDTKSWSEPWGGFGLTLFLLFFLFCILVFTILFLIALCFICNNLFRQCNAQYNKNCESKKCENVFTERSISVKLDTEFLFCQYNAKYNKKCESKKCENVFTERSISVRLDTEFQKSPTLGYVFGAIVAFLMSALLIISKIFNTKIIWSFTENDLIHRKDLLSTMLCVSAGFFCVFGVVLIVCAILKYRMHKDECSELCTINLVDDYYEFLKYRGLDNETDKLKEDNFRLPPYIIRDCIKKENIVVKTNESMVDQSNRLEDVNLKEIGRETPNVALNLSIL